jgi:hypothetical protein
LSRAGRRGRRARASLRRRRGRPRQASRAARELRFGAGVGMRDHDGLMISECLRCNTLRLNAFGGEGA